ncbi:MAG: hypothetical protein EOS50_16905 [Mesorhizobium sp.]|nr:MAG: hypothetical protein EOS50_16905 [Mesorhizobium sp.]
MAGDNRYSPIITGIFFAEMLVGGMVVAAFLWTGKAIALIHGKGIYLVDRAQEPFLYWAAVIAFLLCLVALPLWYLNKGPPRR